MGAAIIEWLGIADRRINRRRLARGCDGVRVLWHRSSGPARGAVAPGLSGSVRAAAQSLPAGGAYRIDVHYHIVPPSWLEALKTAKLDIPPMERWSAERSLEDMEKSGVAMAMTSPTTPQVGHLPAASAETVAGLEARFRGEALRSVERDNAARLQLGVRRI